MTVTNANDAPVISSNGGGPTGAVSVAEMLGVSMEEAADAVSAYDTAHAKREKTRKAGEATVASEASSTASLLCLVRVFRFSVISPGRCGGTGTN